MQTNQFLSINVSSLSRNFVVLRGILVNGLTKLIIGK